MEIVAKAKQKRGLRSPNKADRQLIERDLDSIVMGKDPLMVFWRASLIGDLAAVKALLEFGTDVNAPDSNGRTALIDAAFGGHTEIVKLLISRGASLDASDRDGWTSLMEAASKGRLEIVRTLLKAGANVHVRNCQGLAALDLAAKGHLNLSRALRDATDTSINPVATIPGING